MQALAGITIIEFPDVLTAYCGKLLSDLGAEVIMVEPIGGAPLRRRPPFLDDPAGNNSIPFLYWGTGKSSLTLDITTSEGARIFRRLVSRADAVLESLPPDVLDGYGLAGEALLEQNPRLVHTSVSPFGRTGPYSSYRATDLTALAMGGLLQLGGYVDSPPLQPGGEQAYGATNIFAAAATLLGLIHAGRTGQGQYIDVSMQECVTMALENAIQYYEQEGHVRKRWGGTQRTAGQGVFACRDGYVFILAGGIAANRFWGPFVRWMTESGAEGAELLADDRWEQRDFVESQEAKDVFAKVFTTYAAHYTKRELTEQAQRARVPLCPINTMDEVVRSPQLAARGYITTVSDPDRGLVLHLPGAPYRHSKTPARPRGLPSLPGADTPRILDSLGIDAADRARLSLQGVI